LKSCAKLPEPASLAAYRHAQPEGTWDQMRDDPHHGGQQAYKDIKRTLVAGQRGLCAFCETRIADGMSDAEIAAKSREQGVEHFHPKDDVTRPPNWALHWPNLWAVCLGGSEAPPAGEPFDPRRYLPPLPDNLSCDSFKDHQIDAGRLPHDPEGWILAPHEVPAFPLLFRFAPDGRPEPHAENCASQVLPNNRYPDTITLVARTIEHLNLGCTRLNRNRSIARAQLEKRIETARKSSRGASGPQVMLRLARHLFSGDVHSPWPEFFTLVRWRLGEHAETQLHWISFAG
jgi:uncharacterized protein (TIGR02646 family)